MKRAVKISFLFLLIIGSFSFSMIEKKSFVKGVLGSMQVHITESETIKSRIRNSFGGGAESCIESYYSNLETQSQDTMVVIGVTKKLASAGDCSVHAPMTEIFRKATLPLSLSGSKDLGKFGALTIKIKDKYYSTSLKAQPEGSSFSIETVTPIQTADPELLMLYKNFYRVEGTITGRLYSAMVANEFVDVKGFAFCVIFGENK